MEYQDFVVRETDFTQEDIKELASFLKFEKYNQGTCPVLFGDKSKAMRIVI